MRLIILFIAILLSPCSRAQTLGGETVFNFLKISHTPQLTALGGVNVSQTSNDIGLACNNPALLNRKMHSQMNAVFNSYLNGVKGYHLSLGYYHPGWNTNFAWGLNYYDYGVIPQTDASGNVLGEFRPTDWVLQFSASRPYLQKWSYGSTVKIIHSGYGQYRSGGIAFDVSVLYEDSARHFSASVLVKNMGFQFKKYNGAAAEDIPFDLQAGISKRLENAPLRFSLTAHQLHRFHIRYRDTAFNNENGFFRDNKKSFLDNVFRHLVFSTGVYPHEKLEFVVAYNYLRRGELATGNSGNGLTGFSFGAGVIMSKMQVRYARAYFQPGLPANQLGLNLKLNEYFGLGKFGEKIHW